MKLVHFSPFVELTPLQVIDLGDTMTFSAIPGQADALSCNMPGIPLDDSNLVIKVCLARSIACTSPRHCCPGFDLVSILSSCVPHIRQYNKQGDMLGVAATTELTSSMSICRP